MFRTSDTVLIAVMVAAAALTYKTKHDAEGRLREVRKIERAIRYEEDTITVLKADWSLLTQPAHLQKLAETYQAELNLQPTNPQQIVDFNAVPEKVVEVEDLIAGDEKAAKPDKTVTGSVGQ